MTNRLNFVVPLALAGGLVISGVTSAAAMGSGTHSANSRAASPTATVALAGLELTQARDVQSFLARLDAAAERVCAVMTVRQTRGGLHISPASKGSNPSCVKRVKDQAVALLDEPLVTSMYGGETPLMPESEGLTAATGE